MQRFGTGWNEFPKGEALSTFIEWLVGLIQTRLVEFKYVMRGD
jgi:hypothetical protein